MSITANDTIVEQYFAMWNTDDPSTRRRIIETTWVEEASYVDPLLVADGAEGLDAMVDAVHAQYPGHRFRRTTGVDAHHDRLRFGWELVGPDGSLTVAGVDVAEVAGDGRLATVTGFFGDPPAA